METGNQYMTNEQTFLKVCASSQIATFSPTEATIRDPQKVFARLFEFMTGMYGSRFTDAWKGVKQEIMQGVWEKEIANYTMKEIATGVEACKRLKYPPTLPEFLMLCRPPVEPEDAFYEAVEQMKKRAVGLDVWAHPATFYAASELSFELRTRSYDQIKYRWQRALARAQSGIQNGTLSREIPRAKLALPNDPNTGGPPDHIRQKMKEMLSQFKVQPPKEENNAT